MHTRTWVDTRGAVCRTPDGGVQDVTPEAGGMNVRTRVHEYGGGDYVPADNAIVFSNFRCVWHVAASQSGL